MIAIYNRAWTTPKTESFRANYNEHLKSRPRGFLLVDGAGDSAPKYANISGGFQSEEAERCIPLALELMVLRYVSNGL